MGGVVKAIAKPFKGLTRAVGGILGMTPDVPQAAPAAAPVQIAAPAAEAPVEKPSMDAESGITTDSASRRGKKSLTVRRTPQGSSSGLNV